MVDNHREPFEVTSQFRTTANYTEVYSGGNASPTHDDRFAEVDPGSGAR